MPLVQTVHILCIAVVLTLVAMTDLRMLGVRVSPQPLSEMVSHAMPWIWMALGLLLTTGILLTITEPSRELLNNVFRLKMVLVLALVGVLKIMQAGLRDRPDYWSSSPRRRFAGRAVGAASLVLGVCIVVAGRWIAYV